MTVREGDSLSATAWNRLEQAGEWFHRNMELGQSKATPAGSPDGSNVVQAKNICGNNRRQGEILKFTGQGLTLSIPDRTSALLEGSEPDAAEPFGVLLEPLRNSSGAEPGIGSMQIGGACVALVNITDADHDFVSVTSGQYVLQSAAVGPARILQKPTGLGEKACLISLADHVYHFVGKPTGTITDGGSGTIDLYDAAFSGSLGVSIPGCRNNTGGDLTTDDKVAGFLVRGVGVVWKLEASEGGTGDTVDMVQAGTDEPNADNLHEGAVSRFTNGVLSQPSLCWLLFADDFDDDGGAVPATIGDYYGPARKSGQVTSGAVTRDLYVCRRGADANEGKVVFFQLTATLALSGTAAAVICELAGGEYSTTATTITVADPYQSPGCWTGISGYRGLAKRRTDGGYDVLWMERKALVVQYTLNSAFSGMSSSGATVDDEFQQGNKTHGGTATIADPANLGAFAAAGDTGYALFDDVNNRLVNITKTAHEPALFVKLTETLNQGSVADANPIVDDTGFKVDNETTVEVWDVFLNDGESVPSGTVCMCVWYEMKWVVATMYCAVNDILAND